MKELGFEAAKDAINRSRSTEAIRDSRKTIENLGDTHHAPFEFPVASELLEVYLRRKAFPYTAHRSARIYLSPDGKVSYDNLSVETGQEPTHIFGISKESADTKTVGLQIPSFEEIIEEAELIQPSVTNIIEVDKAGLVVFKAFLQKTLGAMARADMARSEAQGEEIKAINEVKQLELLSQILEGNPLVYSPKVLGRNKAVVAMEYIQGEEISAMTTRKGLDKEIFTKIADVLAILHRALETKVDYIKEEFKIPEWHTANSVVCLETKAAQLQERDWNEDFEAAVFSTFASLVEKAQSVIIQNNYRDFRDVIHGDFKDENMIAMPDGRIALLDPVLCSGRGSMDIAKFGRSILFKDPEAFRMYFPNFMERYRQKTSRAVSEREVAHMLGIDMLNIMRGYLLLPERLISQFPTGVRNVREHNAFYLAVVEKALDGSMEFPSSSQVYL